ncbi:MAG: TerB family tellurite resistance protein [Alphaproteobacteria bacterium]|jgi:DnaJ like chaperone protein|nr:TerB family tellurite resistance protein [Alphaproteobacteria bacterium]
MSIWGKIIGGAAGFALGGPIGALVGVAAGHFVDRASMRGRQVGGSAAPGIETKRQVFAVALIVLCAKMAKADGQVTRDEIDAFKRIFRVPEREMEHVGQIFNEARQESTGFEPYAEQVMEIFPHNRHVREELLAALFHIAQADGVIHVGELAYLKSVARIFQFDERDFERIFSRHIGSDDGDPYEVLGVERDADDDEIKRAYHDLIRENHPDKLMAEGLPQEMIDVANEKVAYINDAYDRIEKLRGMK